MLTSVDCWGSPDRMMDIGCCTFGSCLRISGMSKVNQPKSSGERERCHMNRNLPFHQIKVPSTPKNFQTHRHPLVL